MPVWIYFILAFVVLDILLTGWIILRRRKGKHFNHFETKYIREHWDRVVKDLDYRPNQSVLDADKILDYALDAKGFKGTLGEKLKLAGPRFSDLNGVWNAHKLRNKIAHEMGDVSVSDAKAALGGFKRALKDLGVAL